MWRYVQLLLAACLVALLLVVTALHLWLDALLKNAIERIGPSLTRTSVKLDGVAVSFVGGFAEIHGLLIGNPSGFKAPNAALLKKTKVHLDWKSALTEYIVVEEIAIDSPEITIEGVLSKSNFSVILDNVKHASTSASNRGNCKLYIKTLTITGARLTVWMDTGAPVLHSVTFPLADIHLTDLGKHSAGLTAQEVSLIIMGALNKEVMQSVAATGNFVQRGAVLAHESARELGVVAGQATTGAMKGLKGLLKQD